MLIVRRSVFSGLPGASPLEADLAALRLDVEFELDNGGFANDGFGLDGVRSFEV